MINTLNSNVMNSELKIGTLLYLLSAAAFALPVRTAAAPSGHAAAAGAVAPDAFADPAPPEADAPTGATLATQTPGRAAKLLEQLADGFRAMKNYTVRFEISAGDSDVAGSYSVEGENYYLALADAEVFCDGKVRYEVDNRRREVTVNDVDASSRSLLDNPVRAFDFIGGDYTPVLLGERDGHAAIRLTPTSDASPTGAVTVTVTLGPVRPVRLAYDYDGESISVSVAAVEPLAVPLKPFDRAAYDGYEFIDFR